MAWRRAVPGGTPSAQPELREGSTSVRIEEVQPVQRSVSSGRLAYAPGIARVGQPATHAETAKSRTKSGLARLTTTTVHWHKRRAQVRHSYAKTHMCVRATLASHAWIGAMQSRCWQGVGPGRPAPPRPTRPCLPSHADRRDDPHALGAGRGGLHEESPVGPWPSCVSRCVGAGRQPPGLGPAGPLACTGPASWPASMQRQRQGCQPGAP